MKILIIGSGGREHAITWKVRQDEPAAEIFIAPGNAGTSALGENLPIAATDVEKLAAWAEANKPDLTIVGPDAPLVMGVVDAFQQRGLAVFGPNKNAAQLEGSKVFTKALLARHSIPTAAYGVFSDPKEALAFSEKLGWPQVLKADGLAAGKGVVIALTPEESRAGITDIMEKRIFGAAGDQIVVEEFLEGREASLLAFCDGKDYRLLPFAQDHKRIGEGDTGLNTGGMGAYAPAPLVDAVKLEEIERTILRPLMEAFVKEGIDYQGVLYVGLMLTKAGPKVIEINVRIGDPEAQVVLPLLETSLVKICQAVCERRLGELSLTFKPGFAVTVVAAARNYPGDPITGDEISGLAAAEQAGGTIFHAGTKRSGEKILTAGGRVLAVTALAGTLPEARSDAYLALEKIKFPGAQVRRDIAARLEGV